MNRIAFGQGRAVLNNLIEDLIIKKSPKKIVFVNQHFLDWNIQEKYRLSQILLKFKEVNPHKEIIFLLKDPNNHDFFPSKEIYNDINSRISFIDFKRKFSRSGIKFFFNENIHSKYILFFYDDEIKNKYIIGSSNLSKKSLEDNERPELNSIGNNVEVFKKIYRNFKELIESRSTISDEKWKASPIFKLILCKNCKKSFDEAEKALKNRIKKSSGIAKRELKKELNGFYDKYGGEFDIKTDQNYVLCKKYTAVKCATNIKVKPFLKNLGPKIFNTNIYEPKIEEGNEILIDVFEGKNAVNYKLKDFFKTQRSDTNLKTKYYLLSFTFEERLINQFVYKNVYRAFEQSYNLENLEINFLYPPNGPYRKNLVNIYEVARKMDKNNYKLYEIEDSHAKVFLKEVIHEDRKETTWITGSSNFTNSGFGINSNSENLNLHGFESSEYNNSLKSFIKDLIEIKSIERK